MTQAASAERFYSSGDGLRLFYRDFAPLSASARLPVLCLPGLTRNSRDFTHVAARIRRDRHVRPVQAGAGMAETRRFSGSTAEICALISGRFGLQIQPSRG